MFSVNTLPLGRDGEGSRNGILWGAVRSATWTIIGCFAVAPMFFCCVVLRRTGVLRFSFKVVLLQLCFYLAVSLLWRRCCFDVVLFVYGLAVFVGSACLVRLFYFAYLLCALCLRRWLCWLACFVRFVILRTLSFLSSSSALLASDSSFEMALTKASALFRHPALSCSSHAAPGSSARKRVSRKTCPFFCSEPNGAFLVLRKLVLRTYQIKFLEPRQNF